MQDGERPGQGGPDVAMGDRGPVDGLATEEPRRRPIFERLGLALVAMVMASLFGAIALAAWSGGEPFLAAMGGIGCLMTLWVGTLTLFRS